MNSYKLFLKVFSSTWLPNIKYRTVLNTWKSLKSFQIKLGVNHKSYKPRSSFKGYTVYGKSRVWMEGVVGGVFTISPFYTIVVNTSRHLFYASIKFIKLLKNYSVFIKTLCYKFFTYKNLSIVGTTEVDYWRCD